METDRRSKSHNLKLTEIAVDNQHLQITREATLRLTVGPSPDVDGQAYPAATNTAPSLSVVERRVIEVWVDGFRQASWDVERQLEAHPEFETIRNFMVPATVSPNTKYIQMALPPTTGFDDPCQQQVGGDLQPVRLSFKDSRGLNTAIRWLEDASFLHHERQSAPLYSSQASDSQRRKTTTRQGQMLPLPPVMDPVTLSREQQHLRHTAALPPTVLPNRSASASGPINSLLQISGHFGHQSQDLGPAYLPSSHHRPVSRDPAAAQVASYTQRVSTNSASRRMSAGGASRVRTIPRIERRTHQSAAFLRLMDRNDGEISSRRLLPTTSPGAGFLSSFGTRDHLASDSQNNSSRGSPGTLLSSTGTLSSSPGILPSTSPAVPRLPRRDIVRERLCLSQQSIAIAEAERPSSTSLDSEAALNLVHSNTRSTVDPRALSIMKEVSEAIERLLLNAEETDLDLLQGMTLLMGEMMEIFERE